MNELTKLEEAVNSVLGLARADQQRRIVERLRDSARRLDIDEEGKERNALLAFAAELEAELAPE